MDPLAWPVPPKHPWEPLGTTGHSLKTATLKLSPSFLTACHISAPKTWKYMDTWKTMILFCFSACILYRLSWSSPWNGCSQTAGALRNSPAPPPRACDNACTQQEVDGGRAAAYRVCVAQNTIHLQRAACFSAVGRRETGIEFLRLRTTLVWEKNTKLEEV